MCELTCLATWWSRVQVPEEDVLASQAYMLFYQREENRNEEVPRAQIAPDPAPSTIPSSTVAAVTSVTDSEDSSSVISDVATTPAMKSYDMPSLVSASVAVEDSYSVNLLKCPDGPAPSSTIISTADTQTACDVARADEFCAKYDTHWSGSAVIRPASAAKDSGMRRALRWSGLCGRSASLGTNVISRASGGRGNAAASGAADSGMRRALRWSGRCGRSAASGNKVISCASGTSDNSFASGTSVISCASGTSVNSFTSGTSVKSFTSGTSVISCELGTSGIARALGTSVDSCASGTSVNSFASGNSVISRAAGGRANAPASRAADPDGCGLSTASATGVISRASGDCANAPGSRTADSGGCGLLTASGNSVISRASGRRANAAASRAADPGSGSLPRRRGVLRRLKGVLSRFAFGCLPGGS